MQASPESREKLKAWFEKRDYGDWLTLAGCPFINIGQMIEYLDEQDDYFKTWFKRGGEGEDVPSHTNKNIEWEYGEELCDSLWEAVKKVLEPVKATKRDRQ